MLCKKRIARMTRVLLHLCSSVFIGGQFVFSAALAQDVVTLKPGGTSRSPRRVVGEITDYTGREVKIRTASGRETSLPADRIDEISTQYTEPHVAATALMEQQKFDEAFAQFKAALAAEKRPWVQRQILAEIAHCQRARGQDVAAAQAFLLIVKHDPDTPHYDAIPLAWRPSELTVEAQRKGIEFLRDEANPVAQLIGASWLLSDTSQRAAAIETLDALASSREHRVAQLAEAQLWRTKLISARREDLYLWRTAIDRLPQPLRAGPYYLLGQLLAQQKQYDDAAIAFMRLPILYPGDRTLAAEALLAAAEVLSAGGDRGQATICLQELVRDHADSAAAAAAKTMLAREQQGG